MTKAEIQTEILEQTGIKTTVKKLSGSMKAYLCFTPQLQNGVYPSFPFNWHMEYIKKFKTLPNCPNFSSNTQLNILAVNIEEGEQIRYKKEKKPKTIQELKVKEWGSKNSQLRLDKAAARYANKARKEGYNGPRYL